MQRECRHCHKHFTPGELVKDVSKGIEAARKQYGVEGVHFRCYACSHCGKDNLFVDVQPICGESDESYRKRKAEVEAAVGEVQPQGAEVVLTAKPGH